MYGGLTVIRPALLFATCAIMALVGGDGVDIVDVFKLFTPECGVGRPTKGLLLSMKPGGPNELAVCTL